MKRFVLPSLALALLALSGNAQADSVVTYTGEIIIGTVSKSATGYTIKTTTGTVTLPADKVKRILYDHPPAAEDQPADAGSIAPATPAQAKKPTDPQTVSALLQQGQLAMQEADYPDARDVYKDALQVDPNNAFAGRGLGFVYMIMEKAALATAPLEVAAASGPIDRSLVLALSSSLLVNHNPMRAVKYLLPYLQAHSKQADEPLLNALGISLSLVDGPAKKSPDFADAMKGYLKLNAALEATKPGKRRWGVEWKDAEGITEKLAARDDAQKALDAATEKLRLADSALKEAQTDAKEAAASKSKHADIAINKTQKKLAQATSDESTAKAEYDVAARDLAATPGPKFPDSVPVEQTDLVIIPLPAPTAGSRKAPALPMPVITHVARYAAAFAIAPDLLVTSAAAMEDATQITLQTPDGKSMLATLVRARHGDGTALLKVEGAKFPCLPIANALGDTPVSCITFPEVDLFTPAPSSIDVVAGVVTESWTVHFTSTPRIPGGPLLQDGAVVGVELTTDRDTPLATIPAASLKQLKSLVEDSAVATTLASDPKQAVFQVMAER